MALALDEFIGRLEESNLLTSQKVRAFIETLPEQERPQDGRQLAELLVKAKKLTAYQVQEVNNGAGKSLVLGNYAILEMLGQGGMGVVYKAEHRRMRRVVALKVLSPTVTKTSEVLGRFQREVRAAARLSHPNIVVAHDADEANGTHYLVMEFVAGADLASVVKKNGPLPVEQALDCVIQAARGLAYAHESGVVHRDVKPSNLLLDGKGVVKILDMGIAHLESTASQQDDLTGTGQMMGTVDYMAPEQAEDTKHADGRADIYSLGATLWFLLTGRPIYPANTMIQRLIDHQTKDIPSLREWHPTASPELEVAITRMVAKKPVDRYQSMGDVISALDACRNPAGADAAVRTARGGEGREAFPGDTTSGTPPSGHAPDTQFAVAVTLAPSMQETAACAATGPVAASEDTVTLGDGAPLTEASALRRIYQSQLTKPQRKPVHPMVYVALGLGALAITALAAAGIVLSVRTPVGTIIVELDQPEAAGAEVSVDGMKKITIRPGKKQEPIEVTADEKKHLLRVTKGGFETFTKEFTVKGAKSQSIRVRLEPEKLAAKVQAEKPVAEDRPSSSDSDRRAAEWVLSIGGEVKVNELPAEIRTVAELPREPFRLNEANLMSNPRVTDAGLANFEHCRNLLTLKLYDGQVGDAAMAYFKECKDLKSLILVRMKITDAGLAHFAGCRGLMQLAIPQTDVTDAGLASFKHCREMSHLDLSATAVSDAGLACFKDCKNLQILNLAGTQVTDDGLKHFQGRANLHTLYLSENENITDAGLLPFQDCPKLVHLYLSQTQVSDKSVPVLAKMSGLTVLNVRQTKISAEGVEALRKALPQCKFE